MVLLFLQSFYDRDWAVNFTLMARCMHFKNIEKIEIAEKVRL